METAVLIPCFNEEKTIGEVIKSFQAELPEARIYVGDNNSDDDSAAIARQCGAKVLSCAQPGKGHTVRMLLSGIAADVYVLVDGDNTYRAEDIKILLPPVESGQYDMCIGNRLENYQPGSFPALHLLGNRMIRFLTYKLHKVDIPDMLSGYRVMSRKLVDNLCLISGGFEIETEINIKSVWQGFKIGSLDIVYQPRPAGSASKLQTFNDGYRILATILMLLREYQPMTMGSIIFFVSNCLALALLIIGLARGNTFIFNFGLFSSLVGVIALGVGLILNAINISHREAEERQKKAARK